MLAFVYNDWKGEVIEHDRAACILLNGVVYMHWHWHTCGDGFAGSSPITLVCGISPNFKGVMLRADAGVVGRGAAPM